MKKIIITIIAIMMIIGMNVYAEDIEVSGVIGFSNDFPVITPYSRNIPDPFSVKYFSNTDYANLKNTIADFTEYCEFKVDIPYTLNQGETVTENNILSQTISDQIESYVVANYANTYYSVLFENPDLMQAATSFGYECKVYSYDNTKLNSSIYIYPEYIINEEQREQALFIADGIIADVIEHDMADEEKALVLHDYIIDSVSYNTVYWNASKASKDYVMQPGDWHNHTAYGVLVNQLAVCQGYAQAYNLLLNRVGIETRFVTSNSMKHGWSMVKINGKWYHVDPTHDDPDNSDCVNHSHFLLSDEQIKVVGNGHPIWDNNKDIVCNDSKYSGLNYCFHNVFGTKETIHYNDGYFYAYRHLHVEPVYNKNGKLTSYDLKSDYNLKKSYYNTPDDPVYRNQITNVLYVYEYVKSNFDGSDFEIISEEEYQKSFDDFNMYFFSGESSETLNVNNVRNSILFVKNARQFDNNPDIYISFYDKGDKLVDIYKNKVCNINSWWNMSGIYPDADVARIGIYAWKNGNFMPVAEKIDIQ